MEMTPGQLKLRTLSITLRLHNCMQVLRLIYLQVNDYPIAQYCITSVIVPWAGYAFG